MSDINGRVREIGHEHCDGEPVEDSLDGLGKPLRLAEGTRAGAFGKWTTTGTHSWGFILAGGARREHGVGHEGHDEEEQEEDRIACAQVLQQLESCVGIHDDRLLPQM